MLKVFIFTAVSITALIVGLIAGKSMFGRIKDFKLKKITRTSTHLLFINSILFLICSYVLYLYINKVGFYNLVISSFIGIVSEDSTSVLRSAMTNSFDGKYHWYQMFMLELLFFSTLVFCVLRIQKKTMTRTFLLLISLLICAFSLIMSGQKGPIFELILGLGMIIIIIYQNSRISFRALSIIAVTGFFIIVPLYYLFMDSSNIGEAISGVFSRTLTGQLQPAYVYLEYIPNERDFLMGSTFPNPAGIFPYEPVPITQEAMAWYNPNEQIGVVGSMPTIFWIEAYINFGFIGIVLVSLMLGIFIYGLNVFLLSFQHNAITLSFYIWLILFYKDLSSSFFSDFLISIYLYITLFIFLLFSIIFGYGKLKLDN